MAAQWLPRIRETAAVKLDAKTIAALTLPAGKTDHTEWDEDLPGYGVRLRAGGKRGYVVMYRPKGSRKVRRVTLSDKLTPAEARNEARRTLAQVALGADPQGERAKQRAQEERTLRVAIEGYLDAKRPKLRPASYRISKLYLFDGSYLRPLHSTAVDAITHPDIAARFSAIARKHGTNTAAAVRRHARAAFRWFMEEGWTSANPVIGTRKPADPRPRDFVLTDAELVAIWNACDDDDFGRILRLLILLGSRRAEIGGMRWSELADLDGPKPIWALPGERAKNGHAHKIILPPAAVDIIHAVPRTHRDHLFGARAGAGFTAWDYGRAALDRRLDGKVKRPWRVHDVRRSVATKMADIGLEPHHIEATLNHYSGHRAGVGGVYIRAGYEKQVRDALLRWNDHLFALIEGRAPKILPMAARA